MFDFVFKHNIKKLKNKDLIYKYNMDPPPTYQELLKKIHNLKVENLELKQNLDTCKQTCESYKKAYAHVKQREMKLTIIANKFQSNL